MRTYDAAINAHLASREDRVTHHLFWFQGINRSTLLTETFGFWSGSTDKQFTIDSVARDYHGVGTLAQIPPFVFEVGVQVRQHRIALSPLTSEVINAVRGYKLRHQLVEIHTAYFSPTTRNLLAPPERKLKGVILNVKESIGAKGQSSSLDITVAGSSHVLNQALGLRKSDAALQHRSPGDTFRRHNAISGAVAIFWGENNPEQPVVQTSAAKAAEEARKEAAKVTANQR